MARGTLTLLFDIGNLAQLFRNPFGYSSQLRWVDLLLMASVLAQIAVYEDLVGGARSRNGPIRKSGLLRCSTRNLIDNDAAYAS
jgi:uncharacterized membrane protein